MKPQIETFIRSLRSDSRREPVCAYVYDLDALQAHVRSMRAALPAYASLFYAIKANPDRELLRALLPIVDGFEVASAGELMKVREVSSDVPVAFGGPGKKDYELEAAVRHRVAYVHVESLLELRKLAAIAGERQRNVDVLLRINVRADSLPETNIAMGGRPTPFGLDEDLLEEAVAILRGEDNRYVRFVGFHFHSLSNNMDAHLHADMIRLYLRKANAWKARYGLDVRIVNAGGGFGVSYDGAPDFDWARFGSLLAQRDVIDSLGDIRLAFEPGRLIAAACGYYAAEVVDVKRSHGRWFAVLRGGTHHNRLPASWGHNHPFRVVPVDEWLYPFERPEASRAEVTLVGELCTPKDRLHADAEVERIRAGDIVVFERSGAYCWTISHHDFLGHPHPKFYYYTEGDRDE